MSRSVAALNSMHQEFCFRIRGEFDFLLDNYCFVSACFQIPSSAFDKDLNDNAETLNFLLRNSLEGMALSLSRLWDQSSERQNWDESLSLPALMTHFDDHNLMGYRCLRPGQKAREIYDDLASDSIRDRLRVFRTEALAHMMVVGRSRDRKNANVSDANGFDLRNRDMMHFADRTLKILKFMNDDQLLSNWPRDCSLADQKKTGIARHQVFLKRVH